MAIAAPVDPDVPSDAASVKRRERRALGVACGAHVLHDGFTDLIWVALPIWQAELALSYAAVGTLRMVYTGTMASLQIPAARLAARIGGATVLAVGTALAGLCYCLAGVGDGFWWLMAALFLGGLGAATQHPIASALVTRTFTGARSLSAFGAYNFAGDIGKVVIPALAALMILFMAWRPAYALFGLVGLVMALPIFLLAPRLARAPAGGPGAFLGRRTQLGARADFACSSPRRRRQRRAQGAVLSAAVSLIAKGRQVDRRRRSDPGLHRRATRWRGAPSPE
jgi:MFS family permease